MIITQEQAKHLSASMFPHANFFVRLRERMEKAGKRRDPLFLEVCRVCDAIHRLGVSVHYRGCGVDGPTAQAHKMPNEEEPASRRLQ